MYIHIHILSDIVQRFKVKKIHVDLLFVPVDIKDHFPFQISQKMKLSNDPGKVESNFFCYAAIRITYLLKWNRLVVSLPSFEHFMASLIFIVYKSIDHRKLPSICFLQ